MATAEDPFEVLRGSYGKGTLKVFVSGPLAFLLSVFPTSPVAL